MTTVSQNVYNVEGQRVTRLDGTWADADSDGVIDKDSSGLVVASEITGADTSRYYYTGGALLYSTDATNSLLTENILDPSGSIIASKRFDQTPGYYFYDYDYRGSTTAIIAPTGTLVKAYTYDEYGKMQETTQSQSSFNNEVTFTSSVKDESTGLQYMNARFYNPSTGRFLSQDIYSGNPYDPWTQHLYSYCGNNPTNFIDPTGHKVFRNNDRNVETNHAQVVPKKHPNEGSDSGEGPIIISSILDIIGWLDLDLSEYSMLHYAVQYDMLMRGYGNNLEVPIPESSKKGNTGRADVVNSMTLSVWEVKPVSQVGWPSGMEQLARYINGLNKWGELGMGYKEGYSLEGAFNVTLPSGQTYGVEYACKDNNGMVYYSASTTSKAQEETENSYAFADNRRTNIYKQSSADWSAVGKAGGVVGILAAAAYAVMSGDPTAVQRVWEYEFGR